MFHTGQVHGTPLATHQAAIATHELPQDSGHGNAAHQGVVMPTVGAKSVVIGTHGHPETSGNRFLTESKMAGSLDQILHEQVIGALFHLSAFKHRTVEFEPGVLLEILYFIVHMMFVTIQSYSGFSD